MKKAFVSLPSHLVTCQLRRPHSQPNSLHRALVSLSGVRPSPTLPPRVWSALVSCRGRESERERKPPKGSGINKRKASQTKLQWGFGRRANSGPTCAHKELSVSPHSHAGFTITHAGMVHRDYFSRPCCIVHFQWIWGHLRIVEISKMGNLCPGVAVIVSFQLMYSTKCILSVLSSTYYYEGTALRAWDVCRVETDLK